MTGYDPKACRAKIVEYCEWGIHNERLIHYSEVRPIPETHPKILPLTTDCSGFATLAYKFAGAPDPNGRNYDGYGYTGTMMQHGELVERPEPGDLILYGEYPGHHVVIVMEIWHGAWIVCSHGQENGPRREFQHLEQLSQPGPRTIRSYLPR